MNGQMNGQIGKVGPPYRTMLEQGGNKVLHHIHANIQLLIPSLREAQMTTRHK